MDLWIHWIRPQAFWLLLLLIPIVWFGQRFQSSDDRWACVVDAHLLPFLLVKMQGTSRLWWPLLSMLGWILFVLALAGPSWHQIPTPILKKEQPLVIVLDNSPTMLAEDIKPSRNARAKYKMIDLLKARKEGQTALVVFSAEPYVVTPLTQDTKTLINLLPAITPEIMPEAGQRIDLALSQAAQLINQTGGRGGEILLITGGFPPNKAYGNQLRDLHSQGINTTIYGVGTSTGSPIAHAQGGFLKDDQGNILMARLEAQYLKTLAQDGGGIFVMITTNNNDIQSLNNSLETSLPWTEKSKDLGETLKLWRDEGHWLILLLLPIVLLLFLRIHNETMR